MQDLQTASTIIYFLTGVLTLIIILTGVGFYYFVNQKLLLHKTNQNYLLTAKQLEAIKSKYIEDIKELDSLKEELDSLKEELASARKVIRLMEIILKADLTSQKSKREGLFAYKFSEN